MSEKRPSSSERPSQKTLWDQARIATDDLNERERIWERSMIANGYHRGHVRNEVIVHRALSKHGAGEFCAECPCWHCGTYESDPDGDHSCPCPYHDNDCPWHWNPAPHGKGSSS